MSNVHAPCDGWLTTTEASRRLGVSADHVRRLTQSKALAGVKLGASRSGTVLVDPASVDAYLARPDLAERRRRRTTITRELLTIVPPSAGERGPVRGTRYPLRPLVLLLKRGAGQELSTADIARVVGASCAAVLRARVGGLTEGQADRWAVHVGYHPSLVWGEDWWSAYEAEQRLASMRRHPSSQRVAGADVAA